MNNFTKLLSWNIYFDDDTGRARYPLIINSLKEFDADIICLQEVTGKFHSLLKESNDLAGYAIYSFEDEAKYQNIILVKNLIITSGIFDLPSEMNRKAPFVTFSFKGSEFTIVNVHLESMLEDGDIRIAQLKNILNKTSSQDKLIVCGDMNFGDDDPENHFLSSSFNIAGLDDLRATFDVDKNLMAKETKFPSEKSRRLDRFVFKGEIEYENYEVYDIPHSDHYPISILIK